MDINIVIDSKVHIYLRKKFVKPLHLVKDIMVDLVVMTPNNVKKMETS